MSLSRNNKLTVHYHWAQCFPLPRVFSYGTRLLLQPKFHCFTETLAPNIAFSFSLCEKDSHWIWGKGLYSRITELHINDLPLGGMEAFVYCLTSGEWRPHDPEVLKQTDPSLFCSNSMIVFLKHSIINFLIFNH